MNRYHIETSKVIPASAEAIWAVLTDYEVSHHAILPKPYFAGMTIEKGGQGAGTVAVVQMNVLGAKRTYRLEVSEPEPGRVLEEVDREAGIRTRFILEPQADGSCSVTIASDGPVKAGFAGVVERLLNPPITRHIFNKELAILTDYVC